MFFWIVVGESLGEKLIEREGVEVVLQEVVVVSHGFCDGLLAVVFESVCFPIEQMVATVMLEDEIDEAREVAIEVV